MRARDRGWRRARRGPQRGAEDRGTAGPRASRARGITTSLYDALHEWGDRVAVAMITNSSLTRQELLEEICLRFGMQMPPGASKPAALVMLEKHLISVRARGEHAVLMMDEAQNLSMDLLEEIRLLSNLEHKGDKLLQIFLVGQPELESHLARHELRQLRQRITVHYRLNPLSPDETLGYIHHHIGVAGGNAVQVFPSDACREIYRLTHGIPREINTLASSALIAAYADSSPSVSLQHIAAAASEGDFRSVLSSPSTRPESAPEPAKPTAAAVPDQPPPVRPAPAQAAPPPPAAPAGWPPQPGTAAGPDRPAATPSPSPVESRAESFTAPREARGELTKGLVTAMRRAEVPPAAPLSAPPAMERPRFASQPTQQPVAPPPQFCRCVPPTGLPPRPT